MKPDRSNLGAFLLAYGVTSRQLFLIVENHHYLSYNSSNLALRSYRDQCKACREIVPAEQNFVLLKNCRFNTNERIADSLPQTQFM